MDNTNSNLKHYLSKLNESPLLSREQEVELLKNIEVLQNKVIQKCLSSKFFKAELLSLLNGHSLSDMVKISRKLDNDSPKEVVDKISNTFIKLVESLGTDSKQTGIGKLLKSLALSGTVVHALVTRINRKYAKILSYEAKIAELSKYFEVETEEALTSAMELIRSDLNARKYYARKLKTSESRLLSKVHTYDEQMKSLKDLESIGVSLGQFGEVSELYKSILATEREMKLFKDQLIKRNLRLVVSRAKKFTNRGLDFDDLIQEGNLGLIKAINKHDSSRGTKISTYATWWIDQTIRRAISNKSKTVRIPTHIEFLLTQLTTVVYKLTNKLGRIPNKSEIAESADISIGLLERLENAALHKVGIEEEGASGLTMLDVLPSDPSESPFNLTSKKILRERIRKILATLTPRTEKIIRLRFGIGEPQDGMTLQQIADTVGLTKMGVKVVQSKGISKIKKRGSFDEV